MTWPHLGWAEEMVGRKIWKILKLRKILDGEKITITRGQQNVLLNFEVPRSVKECQGMPTGVK